MNAIHYFQFGDFSVDAKKRALHLRQEELSLPPIVFDLLLTLLNAYGETVSDELIMRTVFQSRHVEKSSLHVAIATLRKILGDTQRPRSLIKRVQNGYEFIGEVREGATLEIIRQNTANTYAPRAIKLYRKARRKMDSRQAGGLLEAKNLFNEALELAPDYPDAWAGLADVYLLLGNYNVALPPEVYPQAEQAALRALELDPNCAAAMAAMSGVQMMLHRNPQVSLAWLQKALQQQPDYAVTYHRLGLTHQILGQFEVALNYLQKARVCDPESLIINADIAWTHYYARHYEQAITLYAEMVKDGEVFPKLSLYYGRTQLKLGNIDAAIVITEQTYGVTDNPWIIGPLGYVYGIAGLKEKALQMLETLQTIAQKQYVAPYFFAEVYLGIGETERALDYLEQAYEQYNVQLMWIKIEPIFDAVRDHPRFKKLIEKLGLRAISDDADE